MYFRRDRPAPVLVCRMVSEKDFQMTHTKNPCVLRFDDETGYVWHKYGRLWANNWVNKVFYSEQPDILDDNEYNAIIRWGSVIFRVASIDLEFLE